MKNSKFNSLFESAYNRYTQGNGFLVGDVVKLKSGYESLDSFKKLGENVKQRIKEAVKAGNNIRVGRLHNYSAGSRYSAEGANQAPAELADCYEEYAPGMVANLMTLPVECLEEVDTGTNLAPVPDGQKDMRDRTAEGEKEFKSKATNEQTKSMKKQTHVEKGDYELATKNTKLAHSNKYNDMQPPKVKNMQKTKNINESQTLLENLDLNILTEDIGTERQSANGSQDGGDQLAGNPQMQSEVETGANINSQEIENLLKYYNDIMIQHGLYGEPKRAKIFDALRNGNTRAAAEEICYSYHDQNGGEHEMSGYINDIESELNHMLHNDTPQGVEDEGNEFTGDLAHTQKGDKFEIGGKEVTNTTGTIAEEVCPICGMNVCKCDTQKSKVKDESGLQAYIGKKKYGAADFKALQQAGREHDKKKKEEIKAKHSHQGS